MPTLPEVKSAMRLRRALLKGAAVGIAVALALEARFVLLGKNFHCVRPGFVYRCAQQDGPGLEQILRAYGIRTVINLRGCNAILPWYVEECRMTHQCDVAQEDLCLSAGRLPSSHEIRRFVEVLERTEYPVLLHCRRGADRTGLASAIVLLLQTDASLAQARWQLGPRYGHVALGRPAYLHDFLKQYESWLCDNGQPHERGRFRAWLLDHYLPGGYRAAITPLDPPTEVAAGRPFSVRVRAVNRGTSAWRLCPENTAGVHLRGVILDQRGLEVGKARSGLFDAAVVPGEGIDLTLTMPGVPHAGRYRLFVDLCDEQQLCFFQAGSEPWEGEFEARDEARSASGQQSASGLAGLAN